jgi:hypothetical protein
VCYFFAQLFPNRGFFAKIGCEGLLTPRNSTRVADWRKCRYGDPGFYKTQQNEFWSERAE